LREKLADHQVIGGGGVRQRTCGFEKQPRRGSVPDGFRTTPWHGGGEASTHRFSNSVLLSKPFTQSTQSQDPETPEGIVLGTVENIPIYWGAHIHQDGAVSLLLLNVLKRGQTVRGEKKRRTYNMEG